MSTRKLISVGLGFTLAAVLSEATVRILDAFSNDSQRSGLDSLAEAAAYTVIRICLIAIVTPLIALGLYRIHIRNT